MYYEGKEFENSFKEKRPGDLPSQLVEALYSTTCPTAMAH